MKTRRTQLMLTAGALAMTVALAGCGGGMGPKAAVNGGVETHTHSASQALNRATQRNAIRSAINAAYTAVRSLTLMSSDADIAAAQAAVDAVGEAIAAGADLPAYEITDFMAMQTGIQADLSARQAGAMAHRNLQTANGKVTMLEGDLATANGKVTMLEGDLATANGKVTMLEGDLATARSEVTRLEGELETANNNNMELQNQLTAANNKVTMLEGDLSDARDAVTMLQGELTTAKNKVSELEGRVSELEDELEELRKQVEEAENKEMAAVHKALKRALDKPPFSHLPTPGDPVISAVAVTGSGVTITPDLNQDGTAEAALGRIAKGDSAGSLGSWNGTHYSTTHPTTRVTNQALVYTNQAAARNRPFATHARQDDGTTALTPVTTVPAAEGEYNASTRTLGLGTGANSAAIKGGDFPSAGTKTFTPDSVTNTVTVTGTYQGASGVYRCTGVACTAAAGASGVVTLGGTWFFVHNEGAMVSLTDSNYLYFGWWLQKDKDGMPTYASAFNGVGGTIAALVNNPNGLTGKAIYTGHAAGKFAINDPRGETDGGHFTANATLNATFGSGATAGLTGTIDNFMANDVEVPWSVMLLRRNWDITTAGATTPVDDPLSTSVNEAMTQTVWSIDDNAAAASGTWNAQAYDEKPGNEPTGDGSNVPTSVTGTFHSEFGSTHTMVGAFGATND